MLTPPPFSPEERDLIRDAFLRLIPRSDALARSLYAHLFKIDPSLRKLFVGPMDEQEDKLVQMLALMVESLGTPGRFEDECRASGVRHRGYGVLPRHFKPLGEALIAALRQTAEPPPSPLEEALWRRLYEQAAFFMREATEG